MLFINFSARILIFKWSINLKVIFIHYKTIFRESIVQRSKRTQKFLYTKISGKNYSLSYKQFKFVLNEATARQRQSETEMWRSQSYISLSLSHFASHTRILTYNFQTKLKFLHLLIFLSLYLVSYYQRFAVKTGSTLYNSIHVYICIISCVSACRIGRRSQASANYSANVIIGTFHYA